MNKVFLIGRLTRDPELRYTSSNIPSATFTIAVNRNYTSQNGEREADFINVVVWRKPAENVKNFLTKGSQVAIDGRIQTRTYDAQDGTKRYVTEVVADNVQFLDRASSRDGSSYDGMNTNSSDNTTPYDFADSAPATNSVSSDPFSDFGSSIEISDDDLPF